MITGLLFAAVLATGEIVVTRVHDGHGRGLIATRLD